MGRVQPQILSPNSERVSTPPITAALELKVLRQENQQLKELITQLSQIVVRNVMDRR
jgi:hypothetical protein